MALADFMTIHKVFNLQKKINTVRRVKSEFRLSKVCPRFTADENHLILVNNIPHLQKTVISPPQIMY